MNQNKDNEFDRQLRSKFENFTPEVSANLWDKIEAKLNVEEPAKVVPIAGRHRSLPSWLKAVAALMLVTSGVAYWYSRPVEVTYLQGRTVAQENEQEIPTVADVSDEPPVVVHEPLDVERLKRLFAKKGSRTLDAGSVPTEEENVTEEMVAEAEEPTLQWATVNETQPQRHTETPLPTVGMPDALIDPAVALEEALAKVPDVQPLVVLDEVEETMLASANGKQAFGLSNILNYVVGAVDQREEKLVTFSNDSEGSLKLDFNFGLAKNKKKKIE